MRTAVLLFLETWLSQFPEDFLLHPLQEETDDRQSSYDSTATKNEVLFGTEDDSDMSDGLISFIRTIKNCPEGPFWGFSECAQESLEKLDGSKDKLVKIEVEETPCSPKSISQHSQNSPKAGEHPSTPASKFFKNLFRLSDVISFGDNAWQDDTNSLQFQSPSRFARQREESRLSSLAAGGAKVEEEEQVQQHGTPRKIRPLVMTCLLLRSHVLIIIIFAFMNRFDKQFSQGSMSLKQILKELLRLFIALSNL